MKKNLKKVVLVLALLLPGLIKAQEFNVTAVWKCGGRQNKNSVAGDELQKTQQNEEIDG